MGNGGDVRYSSRAAAEPKIPEKMQYLASITLFPDPKL
jgi:hypothetical protein